MCLFCLLGKNGREDRNILTSHTVSHVNLIIGLDDHVKLLTFRNDDLQDLCDRQPEQVEHPRDERKNAADLHAQQLNEANARHEKLQETLQSTVILNRLNNLLACERHSQQTKCLVDEHQRATDLHSYQLCKEKSRTEKLKTRLAEAGLSLLDLKGTSCKLVRRVYLIAA